MKIAVMGFGTVGSGVVELVQKHRTTVSAKTPETIEVAYILDIRDFPGSEYASLLTKDINDILNDDSVGIVVETMGGLKPAYDFVKAALSKGKSVVTSNKELVAAKGSELLALARANGANFLFEASVGGGIPLIRPLCQCLTANDVTEINGILNGTTNYILTKMIYEGDTFESALSEAQALGYAEKDPTADVEGLDAGRKIAILCSIVSGTHVLPSSVHTEGISRITLRDVANAEKAGCVIKLIATAKKCRNGKYVCVVSPAFVRKTSLLADVNGVFNAVMVRGDAVGDVMFYGPGAGRLPTASAVVADVIDCARNIGADRSESWAEPSENNVNGTDSLVCRLYATGRLTGESVFGEAEILDNDPSHFAFITETAESYDAARAAIENAGGFEVENIIRLL